MGEFKNGDRLLNFITYRLRKFERDIGIDINPEIGIRKRNSRDNRSCRPPLDYEGINPSEMFFNSSVNGLSHQTFQYHYVRTGVCQKNYELYTVHDEIRKFHL